LILDGQASHINYSFLSYCEVNNIIVFCLPAHSTHILQPLDVGLFGPFQLAYRKAVEDYFLSTSCGINRDLFFPWYTQARMKAYTKQNIQAGFNVTRIVRFNSRAVLSQLQLPPTSPPSHQVAVHILDKHPTPDMTSVSIQIMLSLLPNLKEKGKSAIGFCDLHMLLSIL
jgi:hypothetical protein